MISYRKQVPANGSRYGEAVECSRRLILCGSWNKQITVVSTWAADRPLIMLLAIFFVAE